MSRPPLPIALRIEGKRVLVVGGGSVAARKVTTLLHHGAQVTVIAPEISNDIRAHAERGELQTVNGLYDAHRLEGVSIVIAATSDDGVNRRVLREARERGIPVNIADDPEACDIVFPAPLERGSVQVAVWTGGASPALARTLRNRLRRHVPPQYAGFTDLLGVIRDIVKGGIAEESRRRALFDRLVEDELLDLLERGAYDMLIARMRGICAEEGLELPPDLIRYFQAT